ncbi:hypothetical protein K458DRAFT_313060 [Lentithecium fluviatile CBS 122367]|uniref:Uncharacterized protein n=1 Tax=Lentithecium fluviatile CBS 122367 TaxID=1168545 RepID=A0A6G1INS9_9PLEO|nr:hypothetical protein K458DRAFT_313060 [Lentithecium fluviatile CBS 122367]
MVDADGSKSAFKHRWRAKMFSKDEEAPPKDPKPKPASSFKLDDDVNAFLKPSTDRAKEQRDAAAAAFSTAANKPRIDVAKAQRWPGASEILNSAVGKSPGIGGLKTGNGRKKGLTVSFVRTQPIVIGEGGDECEEPSIEVHKRKKSHSMSSVGRPDSQSQDDIALGTRSPKFNGNASSNEKAAQRGIVTRTLTSHGELSPPLRQKLEMGSINSHAAPPPPPPQRLGPMGLGERPKALARAPTGFDLQTDAPARPSMDSAYSFDSDNVSPVVARKVPDLPPTREEEEDFRPKALKRSQTGWSEHEGDSDNEPAPAVPTLPRLLDRDTVENDSPLDAKALLAERFLQSEPSDPESYSARIIAKMKAEEGQALHDAQLRAAENAKRDSGSSSSSFQPGSLQSGNAFQIGTPPTNVNMSAMAGKTPPRIPSRDPPPPNGSPQRGLDVDDPQRSRAARGPSPGRRPMPPGTFPLDTDPRPPSSSSSIYTVPSGASRTHASPNGPGESFTSQYASSIHETPASIHKQPFSNPSAQQSSASLDKAPFAAVRETSIVPTPPQFERQAYFSTPQADQPPPPPPHAQKPGSLTAAPSNPIPIRARQETAPSTGLARSDTKMQADVAFGDFGMRVEHMQGVFMLMAQLNGQVYDHSPMEWLRVATWWFLKGRAGMEAQIRSRPKSAEPQPERLTQPHVDLAKTWWILTEVFRNHPNLKKYGDNSDQKMEAQARAAKEAGDTANGEAFEAHDSILSSLKMLLGSMRRHQSMPPTQALIQGQQQDIWEKYPKFAPDASSVLSGPVSKLVLANGALPQINSAMYMPVSDTRTDFCYFRMFATLSLSTDDPNTDREPLPAVMSILRSRDDFKLKLSICSQTNLVNVMVGSNPDAGPTWRDVQWRSKSNGFGLQLRHGFVLNVSLNEQDFRSLWNIVDHTSRVESHLRERSDERLTSKITLREGGYKDSTNPGAFPPDRIRGSKLYIFEKFDLSSEGTGKRKLHRGYRVVMVTSPKNRTVNYVNHEVGTKQEPMNFAYVTEPDQAPGMTLKFREEVPNKGHKMCSMHVVFNDTKERNHVFGILTSMNIGENEMIFAQVPLKGFNIESADPAEGFSQSGKDVLKKFQWLEAKTMNQDPEAVGLESAPTVMSESLRILCRHSAGVFSDRMNLDTGELLVRLPIDGAAELTLLRNPQHDMAVAIDATRTDKDVPEALADLLKTLTTASTIRRLTFNSFKDLHAFQLAVTGFEVKFDGIASTFSIARRRMVVPIYKQWTANTIRIQVVEQDNIIQLLAFFEDFSHADAMNFQLKPQDVFEKVDKGGKSSLKLVDCKFALPVEERRGEGKMGKEEGRLTGWAGMKRRFVCLDQIEYPGEHDDVVITFDSAETRDRFAEALPSATVSRKFTVRRKI